MLQLELPVSCRVDRRVVFCSYVGIYEAEISKKQSQEKENIGAIGLSMRRLGSKYEADLLP